MFEGRLWTGYPAILKAWLASIGLAIGARRSFSRKKFHTNEEVIKLLNPGKALDRAGTVITVPNVADGRPDGQAFKIEVDKPAKVIRALGRRAKLPTLDADYLAGCNAVATGLSWIIKERYFSRFADPRTPDGLSPKRWRNVWLNREMSLIPTEKAMSMILRWRYR